MYSTRRLTRLPDESLRDGLSRASQKLIIAKVLGEYNLSFGQASAKTRKSKIVMARHMIHYLLTADADKSFQDISYVFGLNHCTIINSRNKIEDLMETNREFKLKLITVITKINREL